MTDELRVEVLELIHQSLKPFVFVDWDNEGRRVEKVWAESMLDHLEREVKRLREKISLATPPPSK